MPQSIRDPDGHFGFPIVPKNTDLVDDMIFLPAKCRRIPSSGFREEDENFSANQSHVRRFWFSDRPEKYKVDRGCSCFLSSFVEIDLAVSDEKSKSSELIISWLPSMSNLWIFSCLSRFLNSAQPFPRTRNCLIQPEARTVILVFQSAQKTLIW